MTPKRSTFSPPKALSITFAICIVLGIGVASIIPVQAAGGRGFCMQSEMRGPHHAVGLNGNSESQSCCCRMNVTCSELPGLALLASPRQENPASATMVTTMINMVPSLDFHRALTNMPLNFAMSPPVPPYILKLSLLR